MGQLVESVLKLDAPSGVARQRWNPAGVSEAQPLPAAEELRGASPWQILRFRRAERMVHWSIAVPFMVCYSSAVVLLVFFTPHSQSVIRTFFSWLHRISGACLIVLPLSIALITRRDFRIHLYNIRQAWVWTFEDLKWLVLMGAAAVNKNIALPDQGKFNAAEKLNFMMVMCTYPIFIATGLVLWMPGISFLSWVIHVAMAAIATPLMFGHIYMATVNPSTRVGISGMITGFVDRHWARHHYSRWYRENFRDEEKPRTKPAVPSAPPPVRTASSGTNTFAAKSQ